VEILGCIAVTEGGGELVMLAGECQGVVTRTGSQANPPQSKNANAIRNVGTIHLYV
jgi:hypothetical protein